MPLPLFDEAPAAPPKIERETARPGSRLYFAFWTAFKRGADGQSPPGVEHDEALAAYARDGFRVGRLFRPLDMNGQ